MGLGSFVGQAWLQLGELALAVALSAVVGLEREIRQKSAGLRTTTLVGLASALIMLISKYGFMDILVNDRVVLDPSRIAAQIVSGIGFIGGGVIFMRRDAVQGLTTAASVWMTAALGMACGAGLPILAVAAALGHLTIMFALPPLVRRLPRSRWASTLIRISYQDGRGLLRSILLACTAQRFAIDSVRLEKGAGLDREQAQDADDDAKVVQDRPALPRLVTISLEVRGTLPIARLVARLGEIAGVDAVDVADATSAGLD